MKREHAELFEKNIPNIFISYWPEDGEHLILPCNPVWGRPNSKCQGLFFGRHTPWIDPSEVSSARSRWCASSR